MGDFTMGIIVQDVEVYPKREDTEALEYEPDRRSRFVLLIIGETVLLFAGAFMVYPIMTYWARNVKLEPVRMPITLDEYTLKNINPSLSIKILDGIITSTSDGNEEQEDEIYNYFRFFKKRGNRYRNIHTDYCAFQNLTTFGDVALFGGIDVSGYDTELLALVLYTSGKEKLIPLQKGTLHVTVSSRGFVPFKGGEELVIANEALSDVTFWGYGNVYGYAIEFDTKRTSDVLVTEAQLVGMRSVVPNPLSEWSFFEKLLSVWNDPRENYIPEERFTKITFGIIQCYDEQVEVPGNNTSSSVATFIPEYINHYVKSGKEEIISELIKSHGCLCYKCGERSHRSVCYADGNDNFDENSEEMCFILNGVDCNLIIPQTQLEKNGIITSVKLHRATEQWDHELVLDQTVESLFTFYFKTVFAAMLGIAVWLIRRILNRTLFKRLISGEISRDGSVLTSSS